MPEPTRNGFFPVIFFTAEEIGAFSGGTTDAIMEPSISFFFTLWISRIFFKRIAYSRLVFLKICFIVVKTSDNDITVSHVDR
jgi:hypothetical protein